jgi:hypothetical protein
VEKPGSNASGPAACSGLLSTQRSATRKLGGAPTGTESQEGVFVAEFRMPPSRAVVMVGNASPRAIGSRGSSAGNVARNLVPHALGVDAQPNAEASDFVRIHSAPKCTLARMLPGDTTMPMIDCSHTQRTDRRLTDVLLKQLAPVDRR